MSLITFEGASAVFTFFDKPAVLGFITVAMIAATIFAVIATVTHEKKSFNSPMDPLKDR